MPASRYVDSFITLNLRNERKNYAIAQATTAIMHINFEFKASTNDLSRPRKILEEHGAVFAGLDHQIDTYFECKTGRLKLREGNIEHSLIHYSRKDVAGAKQSDVSLAHLQAGSGIREVLMAALEVLIIVDKRREIFFLDNIKFHLDMVEGLGTFVEVEAIDDGSLHIDFLRSQCELWATRFGIEPEHYVSKSYSDLLHI